MERIKNAFLLSDRIRMQLLCHIRIIGEINRCNSRGFNGSFNISENCEFLSQFDPFYIIL